MQTCIHVFSHLSLFLYLVYMALCMHSLQVVVVLCTLQYCIEYSRTISLFYTKDVQKMKVKSLSHVQLFTNPQTVVCQAPPSMGFSRQEYWSGLPFPSPECPEASIKAVVMQLALLYFPGQYCKIKNIFFLLCVCFYVLFV